MKDFSIYFRSWLIAKRKPRINQCTPYTGLSDVGDEIYRPVWGYVEGVDDLTERDPRLSKEVTL